MQKVLQQNAAVEAMTWQVSHELEIKFAANSKLTVPFHCSNDWESVTSTDLQETEPATSLASR